MRRHAVLIAALLTLTALPAGALHPGTDVLVPAAARGEGDGGSLWLTDLVLVNTTGSPVTATVAWLQRGQANPSPTTATVSLLAGETVVLDDVIATTFGIAAGGGAFRVTSDGPVAVTSVIRNTGAGAEFGQGFEGVPVAAATAAGGTTLAPGLISNVAYRSNFYLIDATGAGSSATVRVLTPDGELLGQKTYALGPWQPLLLGVDNLGTGDFDQGTLEVEVTAGAVLAGASRVNNLSGDPITLEGTWDLAAGGGDGGAGIYTGFVQSAYEGGLLVEVVETASGPALAFLQGTLVVTAEDGGGAGCRWVFAWAEELASPLVLAADGSFDLAFDVAFDSGYQLDMSWTGALEAGTLTGTVGVTVSGGDGTCSGTLQPAPFFAGHTDLTFD